MKNKNFIILLLLVVASSNLFLGLSKLSAQIPLQTVIDRCTNRLHQVQNKEEMFKPPKMPILPIRIPPWLIKKEGLAHKERVYRVKIAEFTKWHTEETQQLKQGSVHAKADEYSQKCNVSADRIGDFIYWSIGKESPGGFKTKNRDAFFKDWTKSVK